MKQSFERWLPLLVVSSHMACSAAVAPGESSPDAGTNPWPDAGASPWPDAGTNPSPDAGASPSPDSGTPDSGTSDAGGPDSGIGPPADAGTNDAGPGPSSDAGPPDSGSPADAGDVDAGPSCAVDHGGCSPNATCSQTSSGVLCTCEPGYTGDGFSCTPAVDAGPPCPPGYRWIEGYCSGACDLEVLCHCADGTTPGAACPQNVEEACAALCDGHGGVAGGDGTDAGGPPDAGTSRDGGCSGFISAVIDNGAPVTWASLCNGSWGSQDTASAAAYVFQGGAVGTPEHLVIDGCESRASGSEGLTLTLVSADGTGTFTNGTPLYTDSTGETWGMSGNPFSVDITRFDSPGGVVEGTFNVTASNAGTSHVLTGSFQVCRVPDEDAP